MTESLPVMAINLPEIAWNFAYIIASTTTIALGGYHNLYCTD